MNQPPPASISSRRAVWLCVWLLLWCAVFGPIQARASFTKPAFQTPEVIALSCAPQVPNEPRFKLEIHTGLFCGNDPVNRHDPLGLADNGYYPAPGYLRRDSAPAWWLDGFMPATAAEMRGGRSPWGGTAGAIARSRNVTMPLLKTAAAGGYSIAALPMVAPFALEAPAVAGLGSDLALKSYITLQNSSLAQSALTLLAGYHLFNFATDQTYRGQTMSIDGGTGFSSVGFAARDIFSAGRSLFSLRRTIDIPDGILELAPTLQRQWPARMQSLLDSGVPVGMATESRLIGVTTAEESVLARMLYGIEVNGQRAVASVEAFGSRAGSTYRGRGPFLDSDLDIRITLADPAYLRTVRAELTEIRSLFLETKGFQLNPVYIIPGIPPPVLLETPFIPLRP